MDLKIPVKMAIWCFMLKEENSGLQDQQVIHVEGDQIEEEVMVKDITGEVIATREDLIIVTNSQMIAATMKIISKVKVETH